MAIADLIVEKAVLLNDYYNIQAQVYADYKDFVSREDIDAIITSTPDYLHVEPARAALEANKLK